MCPSKARCACTSKVKVLFSTGSIVAAGIRNAGGYLVLTELASVVCCAVAVKISYQVNTFDSSVLPTGTGFTFIDILGAILTCMAKNETKNELK